MENAADALKIGFSVLMFILALSLSISSFTLANSSIQAIVEMRDTRANYTYLTPSKDLTRTVGVESVVPAMYKAYQENFRIVFLDNSGNEIPLYYSTDHNGNIRKDESGQQIVMTHIDLKDENYASSDEATAHLDFLLSGEKAITDSTKKYQKQLIHKEGLYSYFSGKTFVVSLGEYYQGNETDSTKIKKRVITYRLTN